MQYLRLVVRPALAATVALCLAIATPAVAWSQEPATVAPEATAASPFPEAPFEPLPKAPFVSAPQAPTPDTPGNIGGGIWLAQGPGPAINGQAEGIVPGPNEVSGAIHTVAAHPTNADILYAGAANGGIWKTTNATAASPVWTPLTDFEASLSIGALEFDPTDPTNQTLVAGIGLYSSFASYGGQRTGLLKTVDGGATWAPLGGTPSLPVNVNISGVAPRGMTITASSDFSTPLACDSFGLWRSTDGGATFSQVPSSVGPKGVAFDLASDPLNANTLYVGMTLVPLCSQPFMRTNGIYKSVDNGFSWVKVSQPAVDAFIIDYTTNNIEIAAHGNSVFVDIIQNGRSVAIFHSPDGGTTWQQMDQPRTPEGTTLPIGGVIPGSPVVIDTTPTPHGLAGLSEEVAISGVGGPAINGIWTADVLSPTTFELRGSTDFTPWTPSTGMWGKVVGVNPGLEGGAHTSIRVHPVTTTTVYIGGDRQDSPFPNSIGAHDFSGRLFRGDIAVPPTGAIPSPQWQHLTHLIGPPTSGGGTLSNSAPHAGSREMVFDAAGSLIEVDSGGIYRRTMPATSAGDWFSLNGNIQVTEQHDVAYDSLSNIIISGNQEIGTTQQTASNGLTWDSVTTASGGDVAVDNSESLFSYRYSSFRNLASFRREVWDANGQKVHTHFNTLTPVGIVSISPVWVTPVALNAVNPFSLVLGGCNAIFESFDGGDTIIDIPGLQSPICNPPVTGFLQNALAYGGFMGSSPNPDVLYVGSGVSLWNRTGPGVLSEVAAYPGTMTVRDVVLDPADWTDVYVIESNLSGGTPPFVSKVWWTSDSGASWTDITGNLTDPGLQTVEVLPGTTDRLLVGGRDGVFSLTLPPTLPGGPFDWGELGTGLPNAPVWDMEYDATDNVLLVGTLGRGSWTLQQDGACGKPDILLVNNQWVSGAQVDEACTQLTGGPDLEVTGTGDLTFRSPTVILNDGFTVNTGGMFEVETAVP